MVLGVSLRLERGDGGREARRGIRVGWSGSFQVAQSERKRINLRLSGSLQVSGKAVTGKDRRGPVQLNLIREMHALTAEIARLHCKIIPQDPLIAQIPLQRIRPDLIRNEG